VAAILREWPDRREVQRNLNGKLRKLQLERMGGKSQPEKGRPSRRFAALNKIPACTEAGIASLGRQPQAFRRKLWKEVYVPVTLPPGRARLDTRPTATASPTVAKTMEIVFVARSVAEKPGAA
jgi:hypothetical protein